MRALIVALLIALLIAGCMGDGDEDVTRTIAAEGDVWGGFIFSDDPRPAGVTQEPPAASWQGFAGAINEHPGYRTFDTPEDLATFVEGVLGDDASPVQAPADLPDGTTLVAAYAVLASSHQILQYALEYDLPGSNAPPGDADIWVVTGFTFPYPLVVSHSVNPEPDELDRRQLPVERLKIGDIEAMYQPFESPAELDRSLRHRSAISWFEGRALRSIHARDLSFEEQVALVSSLEEIE
jgi:hypothetical protein